MAQFNAQSVYGSFATMEEMVNENGEKSLVEKSFDLDGLDNLIADLRAMAKEKRAEMKDVLKKNKEANRDAIAKIGKKYYDSLDVGAEFSYKDSKDNILVGVKITTKSNSGNSAAMKLYESKTSKLERYPKFYQVVVPAEFIESLNNSEEQVA